MFCTNCGQELEDDAAFCTNCGSPIQTEEADQDSADSQKTTVVGSEEATQPETDEAPAAAFVSEPTTTAEPLSESRSVPSADVTASYPVVSQQTVDAPARAPRHSRAPVVIAVFACVVAALACVVMVLHVTGVAPWVSKHAAETPVTTQDASTTSAASTEAPSTTAAQQPTVVVQPIVINSDSGQQTTVSTSDYVLPDSNTRSYSEASLTSLSNWQLFVARNEIYARHGRRFLRDDLQSYFNSKSWYRGTVAPEDFNDNVLNDVERANALTMRGIEESRGSEYLN